MAREVDVMNALLELASNLVAELDPDSLLQQLVDKALELLDIEAAGVVIVGRDDELHAVAASSRLMRQVEIFEMVIREGPSYEAYATGQPAAYPDLSQLPTEWADFRSKAAELSFTSGYGFPLRLHSDILGAMNLFQSSGEQPLDETELRVAQGLANMATLALLQDRQLTAAEAKAEQLQRALEARVVIEQAKGMIAERHHIDPEEAFQRLRHHCRTNQLRVRSVAQDIVDGDLDLH